MRNSGRSITYRMLRIWVIIVVLQIIPLTGLFMAILGGTLLSGFMLHALAGTLWLDVRKGRLPRWLLFVPLAAYSLYYLALAFQLVMGKWKEIELKSSNPGLLLQFDAAQYDLVYGDGELPSRLKVPVVYARTDGLQPEGFRASRLVTADVCRQLQPDTVGRIFITYGRRQSAESGEKASEIENCIVSIPETPLKPIVEVSVAETAPTWLNGMISEKPYALTVEGKHMGSYRTAQMDRLFWLPIPAVGCTFAGRCEAQLLTTQHDLASSPNPGVSLLGADEPLAAMLGLRPFSDSDYAQFQGWPENKSAILRIQGESDRVDRESFAGLQALLANPQLPAPPNMSYALSRNQAMASEHADEMFALYAALLGEHGQAFADFDQKLDGIAGALANLPDGTFAPLAKKMAAVAAPQRIMETSSLLYVRVADHVAEMAAQAEAQMVDGRNRLQIASVIAICRRGFADEGTRDRLKERLAQSRNSNSTGSDEVQALYLALLALGEEQFVKLMLYGPPGPAIEHHEHSTDAWMKTVLKDAPNKGGRPNNCMPPHWRPDHFSLAAIHGWAK